MCAGKVEVSKINKAKDEVKLVNREYMSVRRYGISLGVYRYFESKYSERVVHSKRNSISLSNHVLFWFFI